MKTKQNRLQIYTPKMTLTHFRCIQFVPVTVSLLELDFWSQCVMCMYECIRRDNIFVYIVQSIHTCSFLMYRRRCTHVHSANVITMQKQKSTIIRIKSHKSRNYKFPHI